MNKKELIEYIETLPDDTTILMNRNGKLEDEYKILDVIIFTEKKSKEFLEWYLVP